MTSADQTPTTAFPEESVQRADAVLTAMSDAIKDVAARMNLQDDELMAALAWLNATGAAGEFHVLSDVIGLSIQVDAQTHTTSSTATASNVEGPLYKPGAPWVENGGSIAAPGTAGEPVVIKGRVTDGGTGKPLPGAVVDVWQTDGDGWYDDDLPDRPEANLRCRIRADEEGRYSFRSVVPKGYSIPVDGPVGTLLGALGRSPYRPAHIHYKARAEGFPELTTMVFLADAEWLDNDAISAVKNDLIRPVDRGGARSVLTFDIALGRHDG
jgi:catechol 1,2-dioxygenase